MKMFLLLSILPSCSEVPHFSTLECRDNKSKYVYTFSKYIMTGLEVGALTSVLKTLPILVSVVIGYRSRNIIALVLYKQQKFIFHTYGEWGNPRSRHMHV